MANATHFSLKPGPFRGILITAILPAFLVLAYLLVLAEPMYETETRIIVRESREGGGSSTPGFAATLFGVGSNVSVEDAHILLEYIHSSDFIELADERFALRQHYSSPSTDPVKRLRQDALADDFYKYFRRMVDINIGPDAGIVQIAVRAFDPVLARDLSAFIVEKSEEVINHLNDRMVQTQTATARNEVEVAQNHLLDARNGLLEFQIDHAMVDPAGETSAIFSNVAALDSRLVQKRTELRTKEKYMRDDVFELRSLRQEIRALEEQRAEETRTLVSQGGNSMAAVLKDYEMLKLHNEFALNAYTSAFAMLEQANMKATRQEKFLLVISHPHLPEKPVYPNPGKSTATAFVILGLVYGISRLAIATVRDHSI